MLTEQEVSMRNLSKKLVSLGTCIAICSTAILAGGCSSSKNSSTSNGGKIDMKALEKEEKELKPDYTVKYDGIKNAHRRFATLSGFI